MWGVAKRLLKPLAGFIAQRLERSGNAGEVHRTEGSADIPVREPSGEECFQDDDQCYLDWIDRNPRGYVLNIHRTLNLSDARLHRASCRTSEAHPLEVLVGHLNT